MQKLASFADRVVEALFQDVLVKAVRPGKLVIQDDFGWVRMATAAGRSSGKR
jgi:hypothetical protein